MREISISRALKWCITRNSVIFPLNVDNNSTPTLDNFFTYRVLTALAPPSLNTDCINSILGELSYFGGFHSTTYMYIIN